ncbi:MAG: ABC transporter ATP-binding protein [Candidatus Bathyarchaeia archaeon]
MPIIEVQKLFKEYSGRYVLKDINFRVQNGELFVLVGPNGAGKTTLLRILDLLDEPTMGRVIFDTEPIDYSAKDKILMLRRRIGMVFQRTVLFNMKVFDNVAYPLKVRGEDKKERIEGRVISALKQVQLQGYEEKNALTLSGGEAQRVALAQALVTDPELLLLDEPTANLDPKNVSIIEGVLSQINRENKTTIIMTTHNMFHAENLAQRVAVLNEGKIEAMGTFQEVFGSPSRMKNFARLENVFHGVSTISPEGTSVIDLGDGLRIEAAFKKVGPMILHVPPEDIIVSKNPIYSSARNMFEGKIVQITDLGSLVKLKIRLGKDFTVQITKRSFDEMKLNIDSKVYIAFKASSVQTAF